jgi:hypothetical protein
MKIPVSTKVEQAWYVDPDLLARDADRDTPERVEIDVDSPPPPDATLALADSDLEELPAALAQAVDEGVRHYRDVSLRGAIMAPDDTLPRLPAGSRLRWLRDDGFDRFDSLPTPEPIEGSASLGSRVRGAASDLVRSAAAWLEPGRLAPFRLAALSFLAGVGLTLAGVLVAQ